MKNKKGTPLPKGNPTKESVIQNKLAELHHAENGKLVRRIERLHKIFLQPTEPFSYAMNEANVTFTINEIGVFLCYRKQEYLMIPTGLLSIEPIRSLYSSTDSRISPIQGAKRYLEDSLSSIFKENYNTYAFVRLLKWYSVFAYDLRNSMERILLNNKSAILNTKQKQVFKKVYGMGYADNYRDTVYNENLQKALENPTDDVEEMLADLSMIFIHTPTGTIFRRPECAFFVGPRGAYLLEFGEEQVNKVLYERECRSTVVEDAKELLSHSLEELFCDFPNGDEWLPIFARMVIRAYEFKS